MSTEDGTTDTDDVLARANAMAMERAKNRKPGFRRLFSFRGRTNRAAWWWNGMSINLLSMVCVSLQFSLGEPLLDAIRVGLLLIAIVLLDWAQLALHVRRIHDLNMSGGVPIVPIVPFAVFYLISLFEPVSTPIMSAIDGPFLWGYQLALGVFLLFLGIKKGTEGKNDYGPDPLVRGIAHARFRDAQ